MYIIEHQFQYIYNLHHLSVSQDELWHTSQTKPTEASSQQPKHYLDSNPNPNPTYLGAKTRQTPLRKVTVGPTVTLEELQSKVV